MSVMQQPTSVSSPSADLRSSSLGFMETIGQSLANISPTLTPSLNVVALAALAGAGSWLVYGLSTLGLMFVSLNIAVLASRFAAAAGALLSQHGDRPVQAHLEHLVGVRQVCVDAVVGDVGAVAADAGDDRLAVVRVRAKLARQP